MEVWQYGDVGGNGLHKLNSGSSWKHVENNFTWRSQIQGKLRLVLQFIRESATGGCTVLLQSNCIADDS
jgi:hypothetical protein